MDIIREANAMPESGLLETPPIPSDLRARPIQLTDNARTVLQKRYLRRGSDGKAAETEQEMFWRVAYNVALPEADHNNDVMAVARKFYQLLTQLQFFPNSPTFTGAGTPLGQLAACFVLRIDDDMGRSESGIFQTLRNAALIQQTGGGNGFSFSRLRPKGSIVKSSNGQATGPVGFLRVYDQAFGEIAQGGCLTPDTLVSTEKGLLRLDEIVTHSESGWRSHDLTVATDEGARISTQAYNNGVVPVLRLTTDAGIQITGTPNHKFKVMTSSGAVWRRLDELQAGDGILVKLGQQQGTIQPLLRPVQSHGNQVMPNFPATLDADLAFLIGLFIGDGFMAAGADDHRVGFSVAHTSYLIDELPAVITRLFGEHLIVHRQQKENDASVTFVIDNRALKDYLTLNGLGKTRSSSAVVPRLIRQSPPEIVGAFLSGLFEADGALSHGYPMLLSTSEALIREVATLLVGLGCPISIRQQEPGEGHYGDKILWQVRVNSHVGLQSWRKYVICHAQSRFVSCHTFAPDLEREQGYILPNPEYWLEPVFAATTLPQIDKRGTGKNLRSTDPKLRKQMLRYTRGDRELTYSGYTLMAEKNADFAKNARPVDNTWFVMVESVQPAGESLTLDIEVDQNHTYLANSLVTHNSRRGANMAVLRVDHPDVREFITCKTDESKITNFNISVGITEVFMRAVEQDTTYDLINPQNGSVWETVRAREIFDLIVKQAHHNGEPGVLFLDTANRQNPVPHLYELESTNPCGEQFLGPFENCCLGSINLVNVNTPDGFVDWQLLQDLVETSTRFLDDVVSANKYVPAVPQLEQAAHAVRRIGLGVMGLGDLMYKCGIRYGSEEGQEFAGQITEFVRFHAMKTSIQLARDRGAFPAIKGSLFDPDNLKWEVPKPLFPYSRDLHRPALNWSEIVTGIKANGIRNGCLLTVAPTGTIATVSGCEAYGCEPVFALAYIRHVNDRGQDLQLQYTSPLFEGAMKDSGLSATQIKAIVEQVNQNGSCQDVEGVPDHIRHTFVVSSDVTVEEHLRMQASMQAFVDNAISKTVNAPHTATIEDVKKAYMLGWKLGCKGMTVYVTGSREKVVLETHATAQAKQADVAVVETPVVIAPVPTQAEQAASMKIYGELKKHRARRLEGRTYQVGTPLGKTYVTINENGEGRGQPFEIFTHTSKAGSETAAVSEAIGRLISLVLRIASPISPRERLGEIVQQLTGIGGGRSSGFGAARVRSLPDGIAQVLQEYMEETDDMTVIESMPTVPLEIKMNGDNSGSNGNGHAPTASTPKTGTPTAVGVNNGKIVGDLCPECGEATLINEEGCRKCYTCGYSEC